MLLLHASNQSDAQTSAGVHVRTPPFQETISLRRILHHGGVDVTPLFCRQLRRSINLQSQLCSHVFEQSGLNKLVRAGAGRIACKIRAPKNELQSGRVLGAASSARGARWGFRRLEEQENM